MARGSKGSWVQCSLANLVTIFSVYFTLPCGRGTTKGPYSYAIYLLPRIGSELHNLETNTTCLITIILIIIMYAVA